MEGTVRFDDVLDAADQLSLDEQETLIDILRRRMIERRRAVLAKEIEEADKEFQDGKCKTVTPSELMKEILS